MENYEYSKVLSNTSGLSFETFFSNKGFVANYYDQINYKPWHFQNMKHNIYSLILFISILGMMQLFITLQITPSESIYARRGEVSSRENNSMNLEITQNDYLKKEDLVNKGLSKNTEKLEIPSLIQKNLIEHKSIVDTNLFTEMSLSKSKLRSTKYMTNSPFKDINPNINKVLLLQNNNPKQNLIDDTLKVEDKNNFNANMVTDNINNDKKYQELSLDEKPNSESFLSFLDLKIHPVSIIDIIVKNNSQLNLIGNPSKNKKILNRWLRYNFDLFEVSYSRKMNFLYNKLSSNHIYSNKLKEKIIRNQHKPKSLYICSALLRAQNSKICEYTKIHKIPEEIDQILSSLHLNSSKDDFRTLLFCLKDLFTFETKNIEIDDTVKVIHSFVDNGLSSGNKTKYKFCIYVCCTIVCSINENQLMTNLESIFPFGFEKDVNFTISYFILFEYFLLNYISHVNSTVENLNKVMQFFIEQSNNINDNFKNDKNIKTLYLQSLYIFQKYIDLNIYF